MDSTEKDKQLYYVYDNHGPAFQYSSIPVRHEQCDKNGRYTCNKYKYYCIPAEYQCILLPLFPVLIYLFHKDVLGVIKVVKRSFGTLIPANPLKDKTHTSIIALETLYHFILVTNEDEWRLFSLLHICYLYHSRVLALKDKYLLNIINLNSNGTIRIRDQFRLAGRSLAEFFFIIA